VTVLEASQQGKDRDELEDLYRQKSAECVEMETRLQQKESELTDVTARLQKAGDNCSQIEARMDEQQSAIDRLESRLRDKETEYSRLEERLRQKDTEANADGEQRDALQQEISSLTREKQACSLNFTVILLFDGNILSSLCFVCVQSVCRWSVLFCIVTAGCVQCNKSN